MPFSISEFPVQLKAFLKHFSKAKLAVLITLMAGSLMAFFLLISWSSKPEFLPIYTNLSAEDAGEIIAYLKENKIPYKLTSSGKVIQVSQNKIYETRIELASRGLPRGSGIGFEVFDNTKLGMTEFVQNVNYQRALQGELSRTINGLSEVESSRVHIVLPPKSLFIEQDEPASASVSLKLYRGRWLGKDQIQGIVHLVSSSVSRLRPENVTILDNSGKLLAGSRDENTAGKMIVDQLEFQDKKERSLENRVRSMLESVLGQDKAIVRVSCELDFIQQEKTEEMFFPENQVIRSEKLLNEYSKRPDSSPSGIPGLAANVVEDKSDKSVKISSNSFQKQDNTRNYEIGKVTSHQVLPFGKLKRLSVAVIVDGTYKKEVVDEAIDTRPEKLYMPRTKEEMAKLEVIVKRAVNYNEQRGDQIEVANISFADNNLADINEGDYSFGKVFKEYSYILKYAAAGLFVLLSFFLVVRPIILWITSDSFDDFQIFEQLPKTIAELEKEYEKEGDNLPMVGQATLMLSREQENSLKLIKEWIKDK
jgi:flagellar M-ring protein FliF